DLYAVLDPAKEVGGDLYDFFFVDDTHLIFAIGDVSGKGVPASLFMAITRTLLRAKAAPGKEAAQIVSDINRELCIDNDNAMFVTFFLGVLDLVSGEVDYCNAGHNYPYLMREQCRVDQIAETHGTPLGLFEDIEYKSGRITLQRADAMVLYTDGIPEAMDKEGKLYSDERLEKLLQDLGCEKTPESITRKMVESAKDFALGAERSDDITILVLTYYLNKAVDKQEKQLDIKSRIAEIARVEAFTEVLADEWNIGMADMHKINLVLEEVVSNIINYGYEDTSEHRIHITASFDTHTVRITVNDDARAFNPLEHEDPETENVPLEEREVGGLGIFFVKKMMDRVSYRREGGHNILIMEKEISTEA
ncbi:MAG: ATP-binding SpoIIE family protein phosphatase, partial [Bacteroidota bacterium]